MSDVPEATPAETWQALNDDPKAMLVDVRTDAEWTYVGMPDLSATGKPAVPIAWQVFPAMAVIVGAHYLPFIFLYGMPIYGAIAVALIAGATWIGVQCGGHFDYGGWFTAAVLLLSSPVVYLAWKRAQRAA